MVVLSQLALDHFSVIKTCKSSSCLFQGIPVIDIKHPEAKSHIVKACEEYGFLKLINHDVPLELMANLESEAVKFFSLSQSDKEKAGLPDPYGYGSKRIGLNGDVGWIEYLLLNTNPQITSRKTLAVFQDSPPNFRNAVEKYIAEVKKTAYEVLELMADGLKIEPRTVLSKLIRDEKSDSCFRLNHYPPCPQLQTLTGTNLIGFGEHTDPQIISVLRSNNTSGFQICLRDGTWVSVPPDYSSLFLIVGDALQVMTNGRFRSVKHRVLADDTVKSRISMIYFGGPPLNAKIVPLPALISREEDSLYREFTWSEYKYSTYKSKLADYRLGQFEKNVGLTKTKFPQFSKN